MYNYIPHPSNFGKSSMITTLLIEEGHAAYGAYWLILECLRDCPGYRVGNNAKTIAWSIHCNDVPLIERILHNFGLFDVDDNGLLFSPWLCSQMEAYDERKKKLQEAGRRGAAKRFAPAAAEDGQAIASPSVVDGEAIAYNIMQPNITKPNITKPTQAMAEDWREICRNQGEKFTVEELDNSFNDSPEGHAPGYIAQVCLHYGIGKNVYFALIELTENAKLTNSNYIKFCTLVKRIQAEKYRPEYPANFFLSKILG